MNDWPSELVGVCQADVPLADAAAAVRDELLEAAARAGDNPQVVFAVRLVEMEFEVELRADAKAGFKPWAVAAEAEAGVSRSRSHPIAFTLAFRRPDGTDLLVSSATPGRKAPVTAPGASTAENRNRNRPPEPTAGQVMVRRTER
ncbi:trypco2 family protein [Kitasatospora sp. NPDC058406]|uniref:trypco2 family protein n=1 Tax=Kitasatospora sp. NPDC058406 TaxID=3346483 RepID=UPI003649AFFF